MNFRGLPLLVLCAALAGPTPARAANDPTEVPSQRAIERLQAQVGGTARIERSSATGVARLVVFDPARPVQDPAKVRDTDATQRSLDFLRQAGGAFGVRDVETDLRHVSTISDTIGGTRVTFHQSHRGVPVFGGVLRVHYDAAGRLAVANGAFVPGLDLDPRPRVPAERAVELARNDVMARFGRASLTAAEPRLLVFRTNLARGVPGENHLAWEVEVLGGAAVREFVYVDARKEAVLDRIRGVHDGLDRRIYDKGFDEAHLVWSEGDTRPYGDIDIDNLIDFTEDSYNLFASMSDGTFLSWDGADGTMHSENDSPQINCPNAAWVGNRTIYCPGVTADDTVAHEWGHAYTDSTHDLIYQWQPGALNESYSDIWGEVVDFLNGQGLDAPIPLRAGGDCSTFGGRPPPTFDVTGPADIKGEYHAAGANFNPASGGGVTGVLQLVDDGNNEAGAGGVTDACQPLIGFVPGRVALIDRGRCGFTIKVGNAQAAGAIGAVVVNNLGDDLSNMSGTGGSITIRSVIVGKSTGELLRATPGATVEFTTAVAGDPSLRWLAGEDDPAFGGAIRDMWHPECYVDAGKVSAGAYKCSTSDNGGVHSNSGVPNHNFALLVDGGDYEGRTLTGIGLTKASHLYWRAQSVYQVPTTDFAEHADMLELSCNDLMGLPLPELSTDTPSTPTSNEVITAIDCIRLADVLAATEMRTAPTQCAFDTLLDPGAPSTCGGGAPATIAANDFEGGLSNWTVGTREVANPTTFDTPDWAAVSPLPDNRPGTAAFVADLVIGNCDDDIEAGVLFLESPPIAVPASVAGLLLQFDHWIATEDGWDGGNVKLRVNDGPFAVIPAESFIFNPYPRSLNAGGNDNPLAGEPAFSGTDGGSLGGSWGQSQINLSGLAASGDVIVLRFEMGLDGCNGRIGWYVDDVELYACACQAGIPLPYFPDADRDGFGDPAAAFHACEEPEGTATVAGDCDDGDATVWRLPGEVGGLTFVAGAELLGWDPPVDTGGAVTAYDVLKSASPSDFNAEGTCAETGDSADAAYLDPLVPAPGAVWHYLVRAVNACPGRVGPLGFDSTDVARVGRDCP